MSEPKAVSSSYRGLCKLVMTICHIHQLFEGNSKSVNVCMGVSTVMVRVCVHISTLMSDSYQNACICASCLPLRQYAVTWQ